MSKNNLDEIPVQIMYKYFGTNAKCIRTLEKIIWKDGVKCRKCNGARVHKHPTKKHQYHCTDCNREFNVKTGTIFHATKIDLPSWFHAMQQMIIKRFGISALALARHIGVNKNTALRMIHQIQYVMGLDVAEELLSGIIELDEMYYGANPRFKKQKPDENGEYQRGKRGLGTDNIAVFGMSRREERDENGKIIKHKKVRTAIFTDNKVNQKSIKKLLKQHIDIDNSGFRTDGLRAYRRLARNKFIKNHKSFIHSTGFYVDPEDPDAHNNNVENLWKLVKGSTLRTRIKVTKKYLQQNRSKTERESLYQEHRRSNLL